MTEAACVIGLDLGTTSIKAVALGTDGRLDGVATTPMPMIRRGRRIAEHPDDEVRDAMFATLRALSLAIASEPVALAVTSMGEAGALVDRAGRVISPLISWLDTRAHRETEWLEEHLGLDSLYEITGHRLERYWGLPRVMWLLRHRAEAFSRARWWLSVADLGTLWLSGEAATSPSLASRTMALDQATRSWSQPLLEAVGISTRLFPPIYESGTPIGTITATAARATGLPIGLSVVSGGHDRLCGALAARAGSPHTAIDSAGTAETLVVPAAEPLPRTAGVRYGIACYADVIPDRLVYSARVGLSGGLLEWVRKEHFAGLESHDQLVGRLGAPISFGGVMCYPTFGRAVTPYFANGDVPGAILGLTLEHTRVDVLRASVEAPCFSLRASLESIERQIGAALGPVRVEGNVAASAALMQLRADVLGRAVESTDLKHATAVGAALLGATGCGLVRSVDMAGSMLSPVVTTWEPDNARAARYDGAFRRVYERLADQIDGIGHDLDALSDALNLD